MGVITTSRKNINFTDKAILLWTQSNIITNHLTWSLGQSSLIDSSSLILRLK